MSVVHEVTDIAHPIVHAIEQPVQGFTKEVTDVVHLGGQLFPHAVRLSTYFAMGWLTWTAFGRIFPREKRSLVNGVSRAMKRARLR